MEDTKEAGSFPVTILHKEIKDAQDFQAVRKQNVSLAIKPGLGPIMSRTSLKN